MPLELRQGSKWWYGRYKVDAKRYCVNLGIVVTGRRPASLHDVSDDPVFAASRATAQAKLDAMAEEALSKRGASRLIERLYEMKTGIAVEAVNLADMATLWNNLPRRRKPSKRYLTNCAAVLGRFNAYVREHHASVRDMSRVSPTIAKGFLASEEARGVSAKTWNDTLLLIRSAFKQLLPAGSINPFMGIPTRNVETIFRQPFNAEELGAILKAAEDDPMFRPVVITGMCTAMRRGDCCTLRWKDVDLKNRFLNVKTAKTGQTVAIPIFPLLLTELEARSGNGSEYVFPEIAEHYRRTPLNITRRIRRILAAAGFKDPDTRPPGKRGPKRRDPGLIRGAVTATRDAGKGKNRVSIRDFHSFRVTWVTLALSAGVPLELVQKVTGHKTAEIVLKHYFQPGREAFRTAIQGMMPPMLGGGAPTVTLRDEMTAAIKGLAKKLPRRDVEKLLTLAAKITS